MPCVTQIVGVESTVARFKKAAMLIPKVTVIVGYQASYAIFVHEDLSKKHAPGKQAKFLEQPARELGKELGKMVRIALKKGMDIANALLRAGLRLQRESQKIVPVDTGLLKNSAFTELER